jgi:hypothetical protein
LKRGRLGLEIQQLRSAEDRVLIIGDIAGWQNGEGWFSAKQIDDLHQGLRVPAPKNTRATLARLATRGLVVGRKPRGWSLTPLGRERALDLIGQLDPAAVALALGDTAGALFGAGQHSLIPAELAPIAWVRSIGRLLAQSPFESNVFCMTRFPTTVEIDIPDPVRLVIATARQALEMHGLRLLLASDRSADDDLFGNVAAHMWACKYGIALFEDRVGRSLNYNVGIEVGAMLMTGRRCALLRDVTAPDMPTDLIGRIRKDLNFDDQTAVAVALHTWISRDLSLGPCAQCPRA